MPDAAPVQLLDMLKERILSYGPLLDWHVLTDHSPDVEFDREAYPLLSVGLVGWRVNSDYSQDETQHTVTIDFEAVSGKETSGVITRNNINGLSHVIAALSLDRTFSGRIQDIQESDVAAPGIAGRDASATSLQATATFFTPRNDWFTFVT